MFEKKSFCFVCPSCNSIQLFSRYIKVFRAINICEVLLQSKVEVNSLVLNPNEVYKMIDFAILQKFNNIVSKVSNIYCGHRKQ